MSWRLGLDLGTNSLGWAALTLDDAGSVNGFLPDGAGVRIFPDGRNPKDKQSNAAKRREPRAARRNRDRYIRRRSRLIRQLVSFGLLPEDKAARKTLEGGKGIAQIDSDPWILRARALDEAITPYQLGRAIFHLHQRRGFKSNRKTDRGSEESGKVYDAVKRTKAALADQGARTLGELFGRRRLDAYNANLTKAKGEREAQPLARVRKTGEGAKWGYEYYPTRDLVLAEFDEIWQKQCAYNAVLLNEEARSALRDTIEWQHPLKSPPVGRCTFLPDEKRAPKALPSVQLTRILQEVNALRLAAPGEAERPLTDDERTRLVERLTRPTNKTAKVTFKQIRSLLGLSNYQSFNTETAKRDHLQGDTTASALMQEERWGKEWFELDRQAQDEVVDRLLNEENEDTLVRLLTEEFGFDTERALKVADCPLPDGYGRLSKLAINQLVPLLEQGKIYSDAASQVFGSHSEFGTGEVFDKGLPYYGYVLERSVAFGTGKVSDPDELRYGKIANPTVHVALNQVRAVVNDLINRFGTPDQIVVELARDLPLSAQKKKELESKQKDNQEANSRRAEELATNYKQPNNYENRLRLRLYEELDALDKRCIYTGRPISVSDLFSPNVEIEHILPFSRTLDDSIANKTLSMRSANRDKGNRSPHEAFSESHGDYSWEEISKRASELPHSKKWRFGPEAMQRYEEEGGFLARQLTDTQYISRVAKNYLAAMYGDQGMKGSENRVWVIPGRLTSDLRYQWGLDSILYGNEDMNEVQKKNRNNHRHHALDAVVVACTDRSLLKQATVQARRNEEKDTDRLMSDLAYPWPTFRDDVKNEIEKIIVSHKPDHGIQAAMHNDTAHGLTGPETKDDTNSAIPTVVTRKPIDSDSFKKPSDLEKIRDPLIRDQLIAATEGLTGKPFKTALLRASSEFNPVVRRVRVEENLKVIPIKDQEGNIYKGYKGDSNYCYDIWENSDGRWEGEVISTFQAYQLARKDPEWWRAMRGQAGQSLKFRLRKRDALLIEDIGSKHTRVVQVAKFSPGTIALVEHLEANHDARIRDKEDPLKYVFKAPSALQNISAKRVTVSPSGVVKTYD